MFDCGYEKSFCEYLKAGDPNATPEELSTLAVHADRRIRMRVAENFSTPANLLEALARDEDTDVRIAVGTNPATAIYLKLRMACDEDPTVRLGLAQDITSPEIVLLQLLHDENAWVAGQARRTLDLVDANKETKLDAADFARYWRRHHSKEESA